MAADELTGLRSLLAFYAEAGVDALLLDEPVDRLTEDESHPPAAAPPPAEARDSQAPARRVAQAEWDTITARRGEPGRHVVAMPPDAPPAADAAVMAARQAAASAASLDALRDMIEGFEGCGLRATANRLVFADGNPRGGVMFVGEAPGREEDLAGLPFVGRSGQLLDRMMAAIGLDRGQAYIANVIPWRPPGNRTPTPQESQICLPFIRRQIELADPDVLVCLGGPSAQALLGITEGIRRMRGRWHAYHSGSREIRAIATFHPAYLLRTPIEKRFAWRDFLAIRKALREQSTARG